MVRSRNQHCRSKNKHTVSSGRPGWFSNGRYRTCPRPGRPLSPVGRCDSPGWSRRTRLRRPVPWPAGRRASSCPCPCTRRRRTADGRRIAYPCSAGGGRFAARDGPTTRRRLSVSRHDDGGSDRNGSGISRKPWSRGT